MLNILKDHLLFTQIEMYTILFGVIPGRTVNITKNSL